MDNKKRTIVVAAVLVSVALVFFLVALGLNSPQKAPDPNTQTHEARADFIASDDFKGLPQKEKVNYVKKMMKKGPPPRPAKRPDKKPSEEKRKKMHENMHTVMRVMMQEEVKGYYDLETEEEKLAYLDKLIDQREEHHKERNQEMEERMNSMTDEEKEQMRKDHEEGKGGPPRHSLSDMKKRIESSDPKERAREAEFRRAMHARMQQRGIKHGGPPPK